MMRRVRQVFHPIGAMIGLAVMAAGLAAPALADSLAEIRERGEIIIGVKSEDRPFGFRDENGELIGLDVDLAKDIADRIGVKLTPFAVDATSRLQFLELGTVDAIIATLSVTDHRREQATLIEPPYLASAPALLASGDGEMRALTDFNGATICIRRDAYFRAALEEAAPSITFLTLRTRAAAIDALTDGRCAAFADEDVRLLDLKQRNESLSNYQLLPLDQPALPWAIAVQAEDAGTGLAEFLSETVRQWHESGKLLTLQKKWLGEATPWVVERHEKPN